VCKKIEQPLQADVRQYSTDVCWISNSLPRHDTASSDLRVFELMKLIGSLDRKQTFLYFSQSPEDQRYKKDVWHMARCRFVPFQPEKYITLLAEKRPRQLWITNIWTPGRAEFALAVVQAVRRAMPDVRIVIDTMDFHAKKYFRAYMVTRTPLELGKAEQFLQLEKKLYPLVDAVVVVSQKEADDLRENISGLPLVAIIPNIVHPHPRIAGPEGRNDLVFLGNFDVMHNRDAVDWFVNRVLPLVRADDPGIRLHLVGTNAEKYYRDIPDAGLVVEGFVENLEESLARYRVFVCPLTYGAGMKGKIGSAFACGLPVVTTDVGAEGFGIKSGENALVENDPQAFALGCLRLLHDDELWQSLSRGGWNLLQQINEQSGARETVISLLQLSSSGMS
jgi:glycosyltransferase involved in cell wall biosynthesis